MDFCGVPLVSIRLYTSAKYLGFRRLLIIGRDSSEAAAQFVGALGSRRKQGIRVTSKAPIKTGRR